MCMDFDEVLKFGGEVVADNSFAEECNAQIIKYQDRFYCYSWYGDCSEPRDAYGHVVVRWHLVKDFDTLEEAKEWLWPQT